MEIIQILPSQCQRGYRKKILKIFQRRLRCLWAFEAAVIGKHVVRALINFLAIRYIMTLKPKGGFLIGELDVMYL